MAYLRVMSCCDKIRAAFNREIQKRLKLYLPVAEYIGVWRPPPLVFIQEIRKNPVPVLLGKIRRIKGYPYRLADASYIFVILLGCAYALIVLFLPVLHENAYHLMPLLLKEFCHARRFAHYCFIFRFLR